MTIEASFVDNAIHLLQKRQYSKASGTLEKLLAINPDHKEASYLYAVSTFVTGRYQKAVEIGDRMQARWPEDARLNALYAFLHGEACGKYHTTITSCYEYVQQGRLKKALRLLNKHGEVKEITVLAYKMMANIYLMQNKKRKAQQAFIEALKIDASDHDALSYLSNVRESHE